MVMKKICQRESMEKGVTAMSQKKKWVMTFPLFFLLVLGSGVSSGEISSPALFKKIESWAKDFRPSKLLVLVRKESTGEMSPPPVLIKMEGWAPYYRPFEAEVQLQRTIRWNNPTGSTHTVRHDGCAQKGPCLFDSGAVPPNGSYTISGLPPGRYPYHCELHPIMRGGLVVGEKSIDSIEKLQQVAQVKK
jgi:plastocyanin